MTSNAKESSAEEPTIICLNYCVYDEESGYCLTCGRPPIPVTPWSPSLNTATPIASEASTVVPPQENKPD